MGTQVDLPGADFVRLVPICEAGAKTVHLSHDVAGEARAPVCGVKSSAPWRRVSVPRDARCMSCFAMACRARSVIAWKRGARS